MNKIIGVQQSRKVLVGSPAHFELKGRLKEGELYFLIMDFPFSCNYSCLKCYRAQDLSIENLNLNLRKDIISQAKDLGAKVLCIPGEGEPLLYKDIIEEVIRYTDSLGLITLLYTNGSLLDNETAKFMFDHNTTLIVSIDSFNPGTYKTLTGCGDLKRARGNLEYVKKIYQQGLKRTERTIETRLGLITIVTQQNKDEPSKIREWCGDEVFYICNFPIKEGNAIKNWDRLVGNNLEELIEISHQYTETGYAGLSAPLSDGRCAALYNGITIDTNGNVLVCPASVKTNVGNIASYSLDELQQKIRKYVVEKGNPLCIARDGNKIFRHHDGTILQHL